MIAKATNFAFKNERVDARAKPPALQRVTNDNLAALQRMLNSASARSDSYSQSASYYAMTGRKGLWLYSTDDTFMLVAAHPNSDNHLLLFPPMGRRPAHLLDQIVHDERIIANQIQLARMSGQDQLLLAWAESSGQFEAQVEKLLDWEFPAHTLSTKALIEHRGKRFRDFRKNILRAERDGLSARLITNQDDRDAMSGLVGIWAANNVRDGYSKEDLTAPARSIITLMEDTDLPLHGLIVRKGDNPVGFITWEETCPEEGLANSMCNVSIDGNGVTEFAYKAMSQVLVERDFKHVSIGGSESEGLDAFKRKMNPVISVPLQSAFSIRP